MDPPELEDFGATNGSLGESGAPQELNETITVTEGGVDDQEVPSPSAFPADGLQGEGITPSAKNLRVDEVDADMLPFTYRSNTTKEDLVMEYVENFRVQFVQLYPNRPPLLLTPQNEVQFPKFVCTTLRPTTLLHTELYTLQSAADFVASYISYEQLSPPTRLPQFLPSPSSVVAWQKGDSFDMANLLCSLLLGVGYDAYVVCGYAALSVTSRDLSKHPPPSLEPPPEPEPEPEPEPANAYKLSARPKLSSHFVELMREKEEAKKAEIARQKAAKNAKGQVNEVDTDGDDTLYGRRVHAWVLVLAGHRDIHESIFVEPSTGAILPLDFSKYLGVESLWNSTNYWVNMQPETPCSSLSFDLQDVRAWEYVFVSPVVTLVDDATNPEEIAVISAIENNIGGDGHGGTALEASGKTMVVDPAGSAPGDLSDEVLDVPPSWASRIILTKDEVQNRFPSRAGFTPYLQADLETAAEYSRPDGMVSRVLLYQDRMKSAKLEERQYFAHRKDLLEKRVLRPTEGLTIEYFGHGRSFGLKQHSFWQGLKRELLFYPAARLDGLTRRVDEITGLKIKSTEEYENNDDRLTYRSVTYRAPSEDVAQSIVMDLFSFDFADIAPFKIAQKFAVDENKPISACIWKRTFLLAEDKISLRFHRSEGRITQSSRIFTRQQKGAACSVVEVDPYAIPQKKSVLQAEYRQLTEDEKVCQQEIRDAEREIRMLLSSREKEEGNPELIASVYETTDAARQAVAKRNTQEETATVTKKKEFDYLTPYLPQDFDPDVKLNREAAFKVKEACLKSLKERLIEKAGIIQQRLDDETQMLGKKQSAYQRDKDQMSKEEEEEYVHYCNEAMFRIHILEQRLQRHEDSALRKYAELDARLKEDSRLSSLFS